MGCGIEMRILIFKSLPSVQCLCCPIFIQCSFVVCCWGNFFASEMTDLGLREVGGGIDIAAEARGEKFMWVGVGEVNGGWI